MLAGDDTYTPTGLRRVMISALQHYSYCPRQCALIHIESTFDENVYTLRGQRGHERVHQSHHTKRRGVTTERAIRLWCDDLGLVGISDVVEVKRGACGAIEWVYPVEYKNGKRHAAIHDDVQLCAQALCLESMLSVRIERGAIYHIASKKRREVHLSQELRAYTKRTIEAVRALWTQPVLPEPCADARCTKCSLKHSCMPFALSSILRPSASQ